MDSLLQDASTELSTTDLGVADGAAAGVILRVVAFDPMGQVVDQPAVKVPRITIMEAIYQEETQTIVRPANSEKSAFSIQISRLTGRVQFKESLAQANTGNP